MKDADEFTDWAAPFGWEEVPSWWEDELREQEEDERWEAFMSTTEDEHIDLRELGKEVVVLLVGLIGIGLAFYGIAAALR